MVKQVRTSILRKVHNASCLHATLSTSCSNFNNILHHHEHMGTTTYNSGECKDKVDVKFIITSVDAGRHGASLSER